MIVFSLSILVTAAFLVIQALVLTKSKHAFVAKSWRRHATASAKKLILENAWHTAFQITSDLAEAFGTVRTLADLLAGIKAPDIRLKMDRDRINAVLKSVLANNQFFWQYTRVGSKMPWMEWMTVMPIRPTTMTADAFYLTGHALPITE
jgi:hypothetical protein